MRNLPTVREVAYALLLAIAVVTPLPVLISLLKADPVGALQQSNSAGMVLGAMLSAQAAIAALTLAVTIFVMQGISARADTNQRAYVEYVRQSWVLFVFWGSLAAVGVTGVVLIVELSVGVSEKAAEMAPGLPNLALLAAAALGTNLILAGALFVRAIRLANPQVWRELRHGINERNVREAIGAFVRRFERTVATRAANEPDLTVLFPDPVEGSADEAIQAVLDDARRAMADRRLSEFTTALVSIRELVEYAMNVMQRSGIPWGRPGTVPEWPPLRELGRNMYPFREDIIEEGNREYLFELLRLDYWLLSNGIRRDCGDLFTVGLDGYRWNYQISTRVGSDETHEILRDRLSLNLDGLTFGREPEELVAYLRESIRHQESMLSDAMRVDRADDYRRLHYGFTSALSNILRRWNMDRSQVSDGIQLSSGLAQEYRIALMGLAGRAAIAAESAVISDATRYLNVARETYSRLRELQDDIAGALISERQFGRSQWRDWEMEDQLPGQVVSVSVEQYPLTFFAIRLMELCGTDTPSLNLHGYARHVLDWFLANGERLERFVEETPETSTRQMRELAIEVLQNAVIRDEDEEESNIVARDLSDDRVTALIDGVNSGASASNSVERLFNRAGGFVQLAVDADDAPAERGYHLLEPKAFFTRPSDDDRIYYSPIEGDDWGRGLSRDAVHLLCDALDDAVPMTSPLDSLDALLQSIEEAAENLSPYGHIVVVVAGEWGNVELALYSDEAAGYEPYWQLGGQDGLVEIGRYRGHPILRGPRTGVRRLYVVDIETWGTFVRAPFAEGQDLEVRVDLISPEYAEQLLDRNPNYFPDQPDRPSKLRKLQTQVEVTAVVRHGFRVNDHTRARSISLDQSDDDPEE